VLPAAAVFMIRTGTKNVPDFLMEVKSKEYEDEKTVSCDVQCRAVDCRLWR
jgi:hypothetical protein